MRTFANSEKSLHEVIRQLVSTWLEFKYVRVTISTGRDRSLEQNALWFAMYERISQTLGDGSAEDIAHWRAHCKLRCGVPILQVHSEGFRNLWRRLVLSNAAFHSWDAQMDLMQDRVFGVDGFSVTRLMNTKMGSEYTEAVSRLFAEQGVYFGDLLSDENSSRAKGRKAKTKGAAGAFS